MKKVKYCNFIFILILALTLNSCGYIPTAKLAKSVTGEKIYAEVTMSRVDPQNTVLIKDAVSSALISKFGSNLVSKEVAESFLHVTLLSTNFQPLAYDENGYVISYRTVVVLRMEYTLVSGEKGLINSKGEYDFPIIADSVISDSKRFEAIKFASEDAVDEFIAIIAIKGLQNKDKKIN